eukprot:8752834-Alexandrium_andersonii.AAC.1
MSWFADVCTVTVTHDLPDKPTAAEQLRRWNQARAEAARRELDTLDPATPVSWRAAGSACGSGPC